MNKELLSFDPEDFVRQKYLSEIKKTSKLENESETESRIREMFMLNINWFMQTLIDRSDRLSMFSGLETRVPFCDQHIMQYVYNIPWDMRSYKGREKGLLRKAFEAELPEKILKRKKCPFPKTHNPVYLSAVKSKMREVMAIKTSPIFEIADKAAISRLIDTDASAFTLPWYGQLMNGPQIIAYMYMLNKWMIEYKVNIV